MRIYILIAGLTLAFSAVAQEETAPISPPPGGHDFGRMMFEKMDSDKDGFISTEEHEQGLLRMQEKQRAHFATMDSDGDGRVSKEEAEKNREKWRDKFREKRGDCQNKP